MICILFKAHMLNSAIKPPCSLGACGFSPAEASGPPSPWPVCGPAAHSALGTCGLDARVDAGAEPRAAPCLLWLPLGVDQVPLPRRLASSCYSL